MTQRLQLFGTEVKKIEVLFLYPEGDSFTNRQIKKLKEALRKDLLLEKNLQIELYTPLLFDLDLKIEKEAGISESLLRKRLQEALEGFFAAENFSFGKPLFASEIVRVLMEVEGVRLAQVQKLQRRAASPSDSLKPEKTEVISLRSKRLACQSRISLSIHGGNHG